MGDADFLDLVSMVTALELTFARLGRREFLSKGSGALVRYFEENWK
jgi:hypothetical protein